jgi:hypothetical protein
MTNMNTEDKDMTYEVIEGDAVVTFRVADVSAEDAAKLEEVSDALIADMVEASPFSTENFTENQSRPGEY